VGLQAAQGGREQRHVDTVAFRPGHHVANRMFPFREPAGLEIPVG
jgi:hypothetical protein